MRTLTIYTAPGCCLCDEAATALEPLVRELELEVRWVDISQDPALEMRYREEIPVGFLNGRKVFKYRVDADLLRRRAAQLDRRAVPGGEPTAAAHAVVAGAVSSR